MSDTDILLLPFALSINIFILIMYLILIVIIVVYVYNDAKKRKMNALLWVLIVIVFNLLGLIIYIIVRGDFNKVIYDEDYPKRKK